jgi:hypothetical protein
MMTTRDWNEVQLGPNDRGVESFFVKATSPAADRALWLRATIFAGDEGRFAEAWAIAFDRRRAPIAVKQRVPFASASFGREIVWSVGDDRMSLTPDGTSGRAANVKWELAFTGGDRPIVLMPTERLYDKRLPTSKLVTPRPDLRVSGWLRVDGEHWSVDGWRGMQGHNWGRRHPERYTWTHCNQWDDHDDLVLEAISVHVRLGPVVTPALTMIAVRRHGRDHLFTRPLELLRTRSDVGARSYAFSARRDDASVDAVIDGDPDDFADLRYPNPDGSVSRCLNAKLARGKLVLQLPGERIEATTRAAALELLSPL